MDASRRLEQTVGLNIKAKAQALWLNDCWKDIARGEAKKNAMLARRCSLVVRGRQIGRAGHGAPPPSAQTSCNLGLRTVASLSFSRRADETTRGSRTGLSVAGLDAFERRIHLHPCTGERPRRRR